MPTSKSSTSNDEARILLYREKAAEGDHLFLLKELLAICHGDGGHYTELAGLDYSVIDAVQRISDERVELRRLRNMLSKKNG